MRPPGRHPPCCPQALCKSGAVLGSMPLRVCPSKTAIVPVRDDYLPSSKEELEAVARTVGMSKDPTAWSQHLGGTIPRRRRWQQAAACP